MSNVKKCSTCKEEKNLSEFYKRSDTGRYRSLCKPCFTESNERTRKISKEHIKKRRHLHYVKNKEKVLKQTKEYKKNNPEVAKKSRQKWRRNNLDKDAARSANRRASKKQRTPKWLTEGQKNRIKQYYTAAQDLRWEDEMHVDHIIPLNGKTVSGLHVPWNLQLLPALENMSKGNRL